MLNKIMDQNLYSVDSMVYPNCTICTSSSVSVVSHVQFFITSTLYACKKLVQCSNKVHQGHQVAEITGPSKLHFLNPQRTD